MKRILTVIALLVTLCVSAFAQETLKVLAIGNSFSEDAVEYELHPIAKGAGVKMIIGNMYISGCTIETHVANMKQNKADYSYRKIGVDGKKKTTEKYTLAQALKDEKWDIITVQQASGLSGMLESYAELPELTSWIRENAPQAEIVFHQTWAYAKDATHPQFVNYENNQSKMQSAIKYASVKGARQARIARIIPCLDAIQTARGGNPETSITRDGYHLSPRFGRYVAAGTWFEYLTGKRLAESTYRPKDVTDKELQSAQMAVQRAIYGWVPVGKNEPKVLTPQTEKGIYEGHKNYGKSIAVFGGSLSVNVESNSAKQIWANDLHSVVTTYGVGGAGFAKGQGYDLQRQVDEAGVHDIYILWASTNDYTNSQEVGSWTDYTAIDGYDEFARYSQCGGINYCVKTLLEKNPKAEIYFFTSFRFFSMEPGHNPFSTQSNATGNNFAAYVKGQKDCCEYFCIPVLDQFNLQGINEYNYKQYYKNDSLHMTDDGYLKVGKIQSAFLADGK